MFVQNAIEVCRIASSRRSDCGGDPPRDASKKRARGWGRATTKKANYWESNKGRQAETINTKVSGKVNLIFYKLNLLPIFLVVVDKVKKKNRKIVILLSQRPVSRIANSASICKFKSNPSILNRVVPQVLFHNQTKQLLIFNQSMFLGLVQAPLLRIL